MRALWGLVFVLVGVEVILQLGDAGIPGLSRRLAYAYGAFWRPLFTEDATAIFALQPFTMFLSHSFLHGGMIHVLMNSVIILSIGKLVVQICGEARMLALFVFGAVAGGLGYAVLGPDGLVPMVGASGAGFAFMTAWKRWEYTALRARGMSVDPVLKFLGLLLVINVAMHFGLGGSLAWQAHLGGGILGWFLAPILRR